MNDNNSSNSIAICTSSQSPRDTYLKQSLHNFHKKIIHTSLSSGPFEKLKLLYRLQSCRISHHDRYWINYPVPYLLSTKFSMSVHLLKNGYMKYIGSASLHSVPNKSRIIHHL